LSNHHNINSPPDYLRITPEFRLVAACSWVPESDHALRQSHIIDTLSNSELSWDEVASLVLRHGVVGQFCTVMGKREWVDIPIEIKERLKSCRTQQAVRALGQVAELARVARLFAEASVPIIPLKGVALSQELYGDPCVRSSCDLDILVKPDDMEKAAELLISVGYSDTLGFNGMHERQKRHLIDTSHHHTYISDLKGTHIELHWRSYLWSKTQISALWETCQPLIWLDDSLRKFSDAENMLFLADHGARHGWSCLKWLSDLAMLMKNLPEKEWSTLYSRAAFFDLQRVICQTAILLEWLYGIKPPQTSRKFCESNAIARKLSIHAVRQLLASGDELALQAKRFIGPRNSLMLKRLKPSTPLTSLLRKDLISYGDFNDFQLPDYLFWLYLPLRPYFWFRRHYLKKSKR